MQFSLSFCQARRSVFFAPHTVSSRFLTIFLFYFAIPIAFGRERSSTAIHLE